MLQTKPKLHPVVLIGTLLLLASFGILYVVTQGNFGNLDFRSQAAKTCTDQCTQTCQNSNDKIACKSLCIMRCEDSKLGTCSDKSGRPSSCGQLYCSNYNNQRLKCQNISNCCNWATSKCVDLKPRPNWCNNLECNGLPNWACTNTQNKGCCAWTSDGPTVSKCSKKPNRPSSCTDSCNYVAEASCRDSSTCCEWTTTSNSSSSSSGSTSVAPSKCSIKTGRPSTCTNGCTYIAEASCRENATCCTWGSTSTTNTNSTTTPGSCGDKSPKASTCGTLVCKGMSKPTCNENGGCCAWK